MDGDATPLVALRDRREQIIQHLSDCFANDLIDVDTFEARLGAAHQAATLPALEKLVIDLEPLPSEARHTTLMKIEADPALAAPRSRPLMAIFGNAERRGGWSVSQELKTIAVFGNVELDFREARFSAGVTEIDVRVVFGNLEILVPPQLSVECEGTAVFGHFAHQAGGFADPGRARLRVTGAAVFGNVEIHTLLPGETRREARRRLRLQAREQRRLAKRQRRALPPRSAD